MPRVARPLPVGAEPGPRRQGEFAATVAALPWAKLGGRLEQVEILRDREDTAVADATLALTGGGRRRVVVKQFRIFSRDGRPPQELASHDFETLFRIRRLLESAGPDPDDVVYGAPEPLLLDRERRVVVLSYACGQPLDRVIRKARRRAAAGSLEAPLAGAGRWLRRMQERTRRDARGDEALDRVTQSAREALRRVGARDAEVLRRQERIERRLHELRAGVAPGSQALVGLHGDFWPGNIYVGEGSVEVIDFEGFREGVPLQDVACFVTYLELLPLAVADFSMLRRFFLDGFLGGRVLDESAFALLRLAGAIESLAWTSPSKPPLLRRLLQRTPKQIVLAS